MTQDLVIILSVLGVVGQVLVVIGIVVSLLALVGVRGPLDAIRNLLWGYELWGAFVVAAVATGGTVSGTRRRSGERTRAAAATATTAAATAHSGPDTWVAKQIAREIEARGATPFFDEAQVDAGA